MKYILIAGIVILAVFLAVLSQIPLGIEPLTELYFENHTELPKHLFLNKEYSFSFTIHNLEYQDINYDYSIEVFDEKENFMFELDKGSFLLADNESWTINEDFNINEHFDRAKINIKLIKHHIGEPWFKKKLWWPDPNYPNEINIHFWVEEIKGPTITIIPD